MRREEPALPSIVFVNRYCWPDESATAQMLTDLCKDLAAKGWRVSVITSDALYRKPSVRLPGRQLHNGVEIVRVHMPQLAQLGLIGRAIDSVVFAVRATVRLLSEPRWEVVTVMTDPPMMLLPMLLAARTRGIACVYWAQDLFPQIAGELGVIGKGSLLYKVLLRLSRAATSRCDLTIVLGDLMALRAVQAGALADRTSVVHNWADAAFVRPMPKGESMLTRAQALTEKFVVLYSGNAGRAHSFDSTIEAARRLRNDTDIVFLFVGGGPRIGELQRAAALGLSNIRFAEHVPREQLTHSLAAASVSLVTEERSVAGLIVPSKAYGILASGRPLLFVGSPESDIAALVRRHDCGAVVDVDDVDGLVAVLRKWREDPGEVERLGQRARLAAQQYDRRVATDRWASEVEAMLARR